MTSPQVALTQLPKAGLVQQPTPLHPLPRLSAASGRDLWIKRDDVGSVALAGNKVRKFDLVLGQAMRDGADLLITTGAAQSNSARTGAAAAAILGIECRLILAGTRPAESTGNILLDSILGARTDFIPGASWQELESATEAAAQQAVEAGRHPVVAPVGCSTPLGALGFALAYLEFMHQCRVAGLTPAAVVHASSSLGTHAGLLVGRALAGDRTPVIGVDVAAIQPDLQGAANELAAQAASLIGLYLPEPGAQIVTDWLGAGYGVLDASTVAAIEQFARTEAVITDPVYSAKAAAATLALDIEGPLVFWHTGGYQALFDPEHARALSRQPPPNSA